MLIKLLGIEISIHPKGLKNIPTLYSSVLSGREDDFNYEGSGWK